MWFFLSLSQSSSRNDKETLLSYLPGNTAGSGRESCCKPQLNYLLASSLVTQQQVNSGSKMNCCHEYSSGGSNSRVDLWEEACMRALKLSEERCVGEEMSEAICSCFMESVSYHCCLCQAGEVRDDCSGENWEVSMIAGEGEASSLQYYCCCPLMVMEFGLLSQSALHCVTNERGWTLQSMLCCWRLVVICMLKAILTLIQTNI